MDFRDYTFITDASIKDLEDFHKVTVDLYEGINTSEELKGWFFNEVYHSDAPSTQKPMDDILVNGAAPIPRNVTVAYFGLLNSLIAIATEPHLINFERDTSVIYQNARDPEIETVSAVTAQGYDAEFVEQFQRDWWDNSDITDGILELRQTLRQSLDNFNLQLIVTSTAKLGLRDFLAPAEALPFIKEFRSRDLSTLVPVFDSAYYNAAKRYFFRAEQLFPRIQEHSFGEKFTFSYDEVRESLIARCQGTLDYE